MPNKLKDAGAFENSAIPFKRAGIPVKHIGGGTLEAQIGHYRVSGTKNGGFAIERFGRILVEELGGAEAIDWIADELSPPEPAPVEEADDDDFVFDDPTDVEEE